MLSTPAVWKQYNKMAVLHFFLVNSTLVYILFSLLIAPLIPKIQQVTLLSFRNGLSVFSSRTWRRRVFMVGASGEPFYQINVNSRILNQGYLL